MVRVAVAQRGNYSLTPARLVKVFTRLRDLHPDFTLNYAMLLFTVAANPGISQRKLYTDLGVTNSAASRALAVLSEAGLRDTPPLNLIRVDVMPEDRRERVLTLTSKGQRLVDDCTAYLCD